MLKRRIRKKLTVNKVIALIFLCAVAVILIKQQSNINYYNNKISNLKSQIAAEEELSEDLKKKSAIYSSDYYIEKVARDELGLVMPDEKVFIDASAN
ncbi:MAG: hypothetical protein E7404_05100 [Ruminococcaceae bacterium]|nr:hypothetical protein [Oscillospiraceae bacterium]